MSEETSADVDNWRANDTVLASVPDDLISSLLIPGWNTVYQRTKKQRDFWKERAEGLEKANLILAAKIERLQKILTEARNALTV